MKLSKKTICMVVIVSTLILAVLPTFTMSAIESMSTTRIEQQGQGRTADVTTTPNYTSIDEACVAYFCTTEYRSSYNPETCTTTYSAGTEGVYITYQDGAPYGVYTVGNRSYMFTVG